MVPLAGLLPPSTTREQVLTLVPAKGPGAMISGFSGDHGSMPGSVSSHR